MRRPARSLLIVFIVVIIAAGAYWLLHKKKEGPAKTGEQMESPGQVATIKVTPIKKGTIAAYAILYGNIIPAPGAVLTISVPYESRVYRIMVSDAQKISPGDALIETGPSPDTELQIEQARKDYRISEQSLSHTQELFDLKLATNNQLLQAKQTFEQARLALESLEKRCAAGKEILRAEVNGLVGKVQTQEGAIVSAGDPLVDIVAQNRLEARLQAEAENISRLHASQPVLLSYVNVPNSREVEGRIRKISRAVNPDSHLVDVFVTLPESEGFLLGEFVAGKVKVSSSYGLIVPRSAVLPEEGSFSLFTVKQGRAAKHKVRIGVENDREAEVFSPDLSPGENVVILGNYELKDGMAINAVGSK